MPKAKRQNDNYIAFPISQKKSRKGKNNDKDILLTDILEKNKEPGLYPQIMKLAKFVEDDPPIIFGWENVEQFVAAINTARHADPAPPALPPGLVLPVNNVNVLDFKRALLQYARVPNAAQPIGTTALPCTQAQFGTCIAILSLLSVDPWILHIIEHGGGVNILPVAFMYIPRARSNTLEVFMPQVVNSLWR